MKLASLLCGATLFAVVSAATLQSAATPMDRVVGLLAKLKATAVSDGKAEQKAYDKYACWCESTLGRKATDISDGKASVDELQETITKTKADLAAHTSEITDVKKMIAANIASQREATELRTKEHNEYSDDRAESENCVGALEAAVKVLTGAGTGKAGFLGTLQEAQILGAVAGIKDVLRTHEVTQRFSDDEINAVRKFAERPEDYVGGHTFGFSAAQVANNPFGDYAPQSTQIQGILKGMYDSFTADIEKDNADESSKQKAFEMLIATKKQELKTLEATLERQELDAATATKTLADSKEQLDDTKEQLEADEKFFAESKSSCESKAGMWAERVRLRTEELNGMAQAIAILSSDSAKATFENATTTFLQLSETNTAYNRAYARVKSLAETYKSISLGRIAVEIKTNGHFDKIIAMIDSMISTLRKEGWTDMEHRDRCEAKQNANENNKDDLEADITKTKETLGRMENTEKELDGDLQKLKDEMAGTKKSIKELLEMRNKEEADFVQALKDDTEAVALLGQAIKALTEFYTNNKIALLQHRSPEYSESPDKPPEIFEDANYGGKKEGTGGIVAILTMLKEDLEKEIEGGKADDAAAQGSYEKDNAALEDTLATQRKKLTDLESDIAELESKIEDYKEWQKQKDGDLDAENDVEKSLKTDCAWVKSTFKKREEKRKLEMDGLVEAKNYLAGVDAGEAVLPPP
jgi:peptidoglycan hydrolase CwlO-like protein